MRILHAHISKPPKFKQMEFTNFEEFLGIRLDSGILKQWADDLALSEEQCADDLALRGLLKEINEEINEE